MNKMTGEIVTEEEVATDLGFNSVVEMRRWETEMGQKVVKLENELRVATSDMNSFRWHGLRMQVVLERVGAYLEALPDKPDDLLLAIGVVNGKAVDWHNKLRGWFIDPVPVNTAKEE